MKLATLTRLTIAAAAVVGLAAPAAALPTMVRLGYANCAACHIAPQGGGPLNAYGRAIDEAQSLRGGEYRPPQTGIVKLLSAHDHIQQDLRAVFVEQSVSTTNKAGTDVFRPKLMYRNVSTLGGGFRVSGTVMGERVFVTRPALAYDPASTASTFTVNTALVHYRANDALELAAGKDQLPAGLNIPDLGAFTKARNRFGYYDAPAQVKAFIGGKRYQVMPFVFAPGGNEAHGERESGAGTIAEFDLLGTGRTVVGVSMLHGSALNGSRQMIGGYTRLGFGRWGILAEHDWTDRSRVTTTPVDGLTQSASYAQVFWAAREWFVVSGIGERLRVAQPFAEKLDAGKLEVAARLTNQAAVTFGARAQKNEITGAWNRSLTVQLAVKSAQ